MCKYNKKQLENFFNELNEYLHMSKKFCYLSENDINNIKEFIFNYLIDNIELFLSQKNIDKIFSLVESETGSEYDPEYDTEEVLRTYLELFFDNNYDEFFTEYLNSKLLELYRQGIYLAISNPDLDYNEFYEKIDETLIEAA